MTLYELMQQVREEQEYNKHSEDRIYIKGSKLFEIVHSSMNVLFNQRSLFCIVGQLTGGNCSMNVSYTKHNGINIASLYLTVDRKDYLLNRTAMLGNINNLKESPFDREDWILRYVNARKTDKGLVYTNVEQTEEFVMPPIVQKAIEEYAKIWQFDPKNPREVYKVSQRTK